MKSIFFISLLVFISACRPSDQKKNTDTVKPESAEVAEEVKFFPVTEFIRGQITEIRSGGINPVKIKGRDSSWIRVEDLEKEMAEFLEPVIDTINLKPFFSESRFHDQTIDAYTFVYEPKTAVPDSIPLESWIIYVDPKKNKVKTILIQKKSKAGKAVLTWEAGKFCKMMYLKEDESGQPMVTGETTINWDF